MLSKSLFVILAIGIITFILHTPFLLSNPDINISASRGANTDEGLYTFQVRNFINHNDLTLNQSDGFIKTPLFGAILFIPFKIFGTKLLVGRLSILLLSLGICLFIFSYNKFYALLGLFATIVVFSEFYIFHFFHFCLAEILSTVLIFLSIFILVEADKTKFKLKPVFLSATFISLAYFLKIQFAYSIVILPFSIILFSFLKSVDRKVLVRQFLWISLSLAGYFGLYYLVWYLPNEALFKYVLEEQTANRFIGFSNLWNHIKFVIDSIFYNSYLKAYTISFYILFLTGFVYFFITKSARFKLLFIGLSCWFLVELHKLPMIYIPSRYLISLFFSMGLIMSLVLMELITLKTKNKLVYLAKATSILLLISFGIKNGTDYFASIKNRSYSISEINDYLSNYDLQGQPILGAWAPSLSWKSKAISLPVWKNYFNDKEVFKKYNPAIIIAEVDEEDSNQAFSARGLDLDSHADSIKYFTINRWNLKLLWIKESTTNKAEE